ncbi:MAG: hypothetical protein QNJ15_14765 [Erythrobacter sp.]|nr:hypothetical protein [Erythrobacter sp.]
MNLRCLALCAPIAMLVACGGGGNSAAPPPTGGGVGAGGTPAPTPPPGPSYTAFDDLTGDQGFRPGCTRSLNPGGGFQLTLERIPRALADTLFFAETTETWSLDLDGNGIDFKTFAPTDLIPDPPAGRRSYAKANLAGSADLFSVTLREFGGIEFDYLRGTDFVGNADSGPFVGLACVFGVPTLVDDDLPEGGLDYTQVAVTGVGVLVDGTTGLITNTFDLSDSIATFSAAAESSSIATTAINLRGREILANGDLAATVTQFLDDNAGQGSFDSEVGTDGVERGDFIGNLESVGNPGAAGAFVGWFYGPQGVEAGYAFILQYSVPGSIDQLIFQGQVLAKK